MSPTSCQTAPPRGWIVILTDRGNSGQSRGTDRKCPRYRGLRTLALASHREPHAILPFVVRIARGADQLADEIET